MKSKQRDIVHAALKARTVPALIEGPVVLLNQALATIGAK
jgi:hypothetical protein